MPESDAEPSEPLTRGILLSLAGGGIGALLWFTVSWLFATEARAIALVIGILCGFGMILGTPRRGFDVGMTAGVIATCAIIAAQWAVFTLLLSAQLRTEAASWVNAPQRQDQVVAAILMLDAARAGRQPLSNTQAMAQVATMSEADRKALLERNGDLLADALVRATESRIDEQGFLQTMIRGREIYYIVTAILAAVALGVFGKETLQ